MQDLTDFLDGVQLNKDQQNAIPLQIKLLYSNNIQVQLNALESLVAFADGSQKNRAHLLSRSCLSAVLDLLQAAHYQTTEPLKLSVLSHASHLVAQLLDKAALPAQLDDIILVLSALFKNCLDPHVLYHTCSAFYIIAEGGVRPASAVISSGILVRLTELLRSDSKSHQTLALKVINSLTRADVHQLQQVLDTNLLLDSLSITLSVPRDRQEGTTMSKITCQVLAALTLGRRQYIAALIVKNIYARMLELCTVPDLFSNALDVLVNCAKCAGAEEASLMVAQGVIILLFELVTKISQYHEEVFKIVEILDALLRAMDAQNGAPNPLAIYIESGGGKQILQALLNSDNQLVYETLDTTLMQYFV